MKRLIAYIILVASSMYMALIYRNQAFLNIFYGGILAFFILLVLNIISIHGVYISINTPESVIQAGKEINVEIIFNNRGILPTGRIGVFVKSINSYTGKKEVTKFYGSADGRGSSVARCYYHAKNPGSIEFCIKKIWAEDYLGILKLPVFKYDRYEHLVIVIPELYEVPVCIVHGAYKDTNESNSMSQVFMAPDSMENGETRQYRQGDSFKNINWKLSAKAGELMSRQKYSNAICMAVFFIGSGNIDNAYKKKCFIQAVLSISASLVSNGCIHYICWYDNSEETIIRYLVRQESDSYCFVQSGINIITGKNKKCTDMSLIKDMYIRKYNEQENIPFIAINTDFELFAYDRRIIQYNFKDLKNSMGAAEILI